MKHHKIEVPLTEDLMREHGILNRVLLIYQAIIDKIHHQQDFKLSPLDQAVQIIQTFIEGHHERMEEDYIFPLFEKYDQHLDLIATLKDQHRKGREITVHLQKIIAANELNNKQRFLIQHYLTEFITMYRPHEATEDTKIFPLVRSLLTEKEFEKLGDLFEDFEHQTLGKGGLQKILKKLDILDHQVGIANLAQFTPHD